MGHKLVTCAEHFASSAETNLSPQISKLLEPPLISEDENINSIVKVQHWRFQCILKGKTMGLPSDLLPSEDLLQPFLIFLDSHSRCRLRVPMQNPNSWREKKKENKKGNGSDYKDPNYSTIRIKLRFPTIEAPLYLYSTFFYYFSSEFV